VSQSTYVFSPPSVYSLPVRGTKQRLAINRLFFVGRNYHAHAVEMGRPVDKSVESPFYFTKSPSTLVESGGTAPYPSQTKDYQHEMELVVVVGAPGFRVAEADAQELIYGYACGLDMTRRDLQLAARDKGRPWDFGKDVEHSSVVSEIVPRPGIVLDKGELALKVNGKLRQKSDLSKTRLEHSRAERRPVEVLSPTARRPHLHGDPGSRRPGTAGRPHRGSGRGGRSDQPDRRRGGLRRLERGAALIERTATTRTHQETQNGSKPSEIRG